MKKKTKDQKRVIRNCGMRPLFWKVLSEDDKYLVVMNWLTGEVRLLGK